MSLLGFLLGAEPDDVPPPAPLPVPTPPPTTVRTSVIGVIDHIEIAISRLVTQFREKA